MYGPDWVLRGLGAFLMLMVAFLGWIIWVSVTAESFSLIKDQWRCTSSATTIIMQTQVIGNTTSLVPMPVVECGQWTRK